jgi:DNA-binding NarL/FixJ family response regulator
MLAPLHHRESVRIVLIDDNVQSCRLLSRFFMLEDGLEIVGTAYSGLDGLRLVEYLQPDLVLTDFNLPDIDGHAVTAGVRQRHPGISVVVMSADCPTALADLVRRAGASAFILKNGDPGEIVRAVRRTLRLM